MTARDHDELLRRVRKAEGDLRAARRLWEQYRLNVAANCPDAARLAIEAWQGLDLLLAAPTPAEPPKASEPASPHGDIPGRPGLPITFEDDDESPTSGS